ncbi:MAG: hypothetical protein LWX07_09895 [Bacteroidetes bacterium]|nr:hypothetical protein [Bacteroidota bacterium]
MKTAIIILGFILLPTFLTYAQVTDKDTGKNNPQTVYLIIKHVDCPDCQGLGYLNKIIYDFNRQDNGRHASNVGTKIARITCPYCGGTGKLEIREYKPKL